MVKCPAMLARPTTHFSSIASQLKCNWLQTEWTARIMWPYMSNNMVFVVVETHLTTDCTGGNMHKCLSEGHHSLFSLFVVSVTPRVSRPSRRLRLRGHVSHYSQLLLYFFPDCVENIIQLPAVQQANTAEPTQLLTMCLLGVVNHRHKWLAATDKKMG